MTIWVDKENCSNCQYAVSNNKFCYIRDIHIDNSIWTYCINHQRFNKNEISTPMGPVYNYGPDHYDRDVIIKSPNTQLVKDTLLEEANKIKEVIDYHSIDLLRDEVIIWQLGEFKEQYAILLLKRIERFSEKITVSPPAQAANCTRKSLIEAATLALDKINNKVELDDEIDLSTFF